MKDKSENVSSNTGYYFLDAKSSKAVVESSKPDSFYIAIVTRVTKQGIFDEKINRVIPKFFNKRQGINYNYSLLLVMRDKETVTFYPKI